MKPHIIVSICIMLFIVSGCAKPMPGSYSPASTADKDVLLAAEFAVAAKKRLLEKESPSGQNNIELIKIIKAKRQIVAGINYQLNLRVNCNGENREADVLVWWQEWRTPDPYILTSWEWR